MVLSEIFSFREVIKSDPDCADLLSAYDRGKTEKTVRVAAQTDGLLVLCREDGFYKVVDPKNGLCRLFALFMSDGGDVSILIASPPRCISFDRTNGNSSLIPSFSLNYADPSSQLAKRSLAFYIVQPHSPSVLCLRSSEEPNQEYTVATVVTFQTRPCALVSSADFGAAGDANGMVAVWRTRGGSALTASERMLWQRKFMENPVGAEISSLNLASNKLFVSSEDLTIRVVEAATGIVTANLVPPTSSPITLLSTCEFFGPDRSKIMVPASSEPFTSIVLGTRQGHLVLVQSNPQSNANMLQYENCSWSIISSVNIPKSDIGCHLLRCISLDQNYILAGGQDGRIYIYDRCDGAKKKMSFLATKEKIELRLDIPLETSVVHVQITEDSHVVVVEENGNVYRWAWSDILQASGDNSMVEEELDNISVQDNIMPDDKNIHDEQDAIIVCMDDLVERVEKELEGNVPQHGHYLSDSDYASSTDVVPLSISSQEDKHERSLFHHHPGVATPGGLTSVAPSSIAGSVAAAPSPAQQKESNSSARYEVTQRSRSSSLQATVESELCRPPRPPVRIASTNASSIQSVSPRQTISRVPRANGCLRPPLSGSHSKSPVKNRQMERLTALATNEKAITDKSSECNTITQDQFTNACTGSTTEMIEQRKLDHSSQVFDKNKFRLANKIAASCIAQEKVVKGTHFQMNDTVFAAVTKPCGSKAGSPSRHAETEYHDDLAPVTLARERSRCRSSARHRSSLHYETERKASAPDVTAHLCHSLLTPHCVDGVIDSTPIFISDSSHPKTAPYLLMLPIPLPPTPPFF